MNENLQNALVEILTRVTSGIDSSVGFLSAELPEVIQQLLMWKMVESGVMFVVGVALLIVSGFASYKLYKYARGDAPVDQDVCVYSSFACALFAILAVCMLNLTWLQIWVAPKLFLIEYAAKLLK